jgi:hypothetical protein
MVTLLIMSFFLSSKRLFVDVMKITKGATLRVHGNDKGTIICLCTERSSAPGNYFDVFRCIMKVLDDRVPLSQNGGVEREVLGRSQNYFTNVSVPPIT